VVTLIARSDLVGVELFFLKTPTTTMDPWTPVYDLHRHDTDARPTVELEAQYLPLMSASACFAYCMALSCTFTLLQLSFVSAFHPDPCHVH
jgi:hypothetical protein